MTADAVKSGEYDVVVIGAGPVGENVADRARAAGLSTAVVESELIGGECSYWACMPSKALLRPVVARADARHVPGLSGAVRGPLDADAVLAYRDEQTSHWKDDGQVGWLEGIGADIYRGKGRLTGVGRSPSPALTGPSSTSPPGTPSPSAPAAGPSSPPCPGSRTSVPGRAARRPAPRRCPAASSWSAGEWSVWRWPPPGKGSAPR